MRKFRVRVEGLEGVLVVSSFEELEQRAEEQRPVRGDARDAQHLGRERGFFIGNLLVRIRYTF